MDERLVALQAALWPNMGYPLASKVYWVLDGARDPTIAELVRSGDLPYQCLFAGEMHPRLQAAAPYLVQLLPDVALSAQLLEQGWGKAWGILAFSGPDASMQELRLHFKKFLRVQTEDGKELLFRFYDPRALAVYLPTCTSEELSNFLGPLTDVLVETAGGGAVQRFGHARQDVLALSQVSG